MGLQSAQWETDRKQAWLPLLLLWQTFCSNTSFALSGWLPNSSDKGATSAAAWKFQVAGAFGKLLQRYPPGDANGKGMGEPSPSSEARVPQELEERWYELEGSDTVTVADFSQEVRKSCRASTRSR